MDFKINFKTDALIQLQEKDQIENKHREEIVKLEDTIKTMATENQNLRAQLAQKCDP